MPTTNPTTYSTNTTVRIKSCKWKGGNNKYREKAPEWTRNHLIRRNINYTHIKYMSMKIFRECSNVNSKFKNRKNQVLGWISNSLLINQNPPKNEKKKKNHQNPPKKPKTDLSSIHRQTWGNGRQVPLTDATYCVLPRHDMSNVHCIARWCGIHSKYRRSDSSRPSFTALWIFTFRIGAF